MEKVEVSKEILEQMDRQLNFSFFFTGIIVTLAVVVVGYQLTINKKIVKEIQEENKTIIANVTAPLFIVTINQIVRMGAYGIEDVKALYNIYAQNFSSNEEVRERMAALKFRYIRSLIFNIGLMIPLDNKEEYDRLKNEKPMVILENAQKIVEQYEKYSAEEIREYLDQIDEARSEIRQIKVIFKNI